MERSASCHVGAMFLAFLTRRSPAMTHFGMKKLSLLLAAPVLAVLVALSAATPVQAALQVDVTQGTAQPLPIAIPDFLSAGGDPQAGPIIAGVVRADLERSGLFRPLDQKGFVEHITNINKVPTFASWRSITAQGL